MPRLPVAEPDVPGMPPDPPGGRMPQAFPAEPDAWAVTHLHGGSNQRFFHLWFSHGRRARPFWLIGTDGGFRFEPLRLTGVWLAPASRVDLILDLTGVPQGTRITMRKEDFPRAGTTKTR